MILHVDVGIQPASPNVAEAAADWRSLVAAQLRRVQVELHDCLSGAKSDPRDVVHGAGATGRSTERSDAAPRADQAVPLIAAAPRRATTVRFDVPPVEEFVAQAAD